MTATQRMPESDAGLPDRIYLQWSGDADPNLLQGEPPPDASDVTWCRERIWDWDVEYVLATRLAEAEKLLNELVDWVNAYEPLCGEDEGCGLCNERRPIMEKIQKFVSQKDSTNGRVA